MSFLFPWVAFPPGFQVLIAVLEKCGRNPREKMSSENQKDNMFLEK
jgi:hypothetical protein